MFLRTVALQGVPRSEKTLLVRSVKMDSVRFPGPKISFMRSRNVKLSGISRPAKGSFVISSLVICKRIPRPEIFIHGICIYDY